MIQPEQMQIKKPFQAFKKAFEQAAKKPFKKPLINPCPLKSLNKKP